MTGSLARLVASLCAVAWLTPGARAAQPYAFDAAGRPARVNARWELQREDGRSFDILTSFVRCGPQIFVGDTQNQVYRLDTTGTSAILRRFAGEDEGLGRVAALAADCDRDRLYVVNTGPRTVVTLNRMSGEVLSKQPFKRELYETRTARLVDRDVLFIGGLWNADTPRGLPRREPATFFESTWLGE
jgi:hypothetical protein